MTGTINFDYVTVRYDQHTGQVVWSTSYHFRGSDVAYAVAVDTNDHVFVSGSSQGVDTGHDIATIKYDGETGQTLWIARYNGPGNAADAAYAMAVDQVGNIYAAGSSRGIGTGSDYATIKYDGRPGEQLWVARHATPVSESANAATTDQTGNVFVIGTSGTIKYDGQTGQMLWGPVMSGNASAITVDQEGDVYVTACDDRSQQNGDLQVKWSNRTTVMGDHFIPCSSRWSKSHYPRLYGRCHRDRRNANLNGWTG